MLEPFPATPPGSSLSATPTTSFHAQSLLATLPATVLARIFSSLSSADLLRCALVSKVRAPCVCGACDVLIDWLV